MATKDKPATIAGLAAGKIIDKTILILKNQDFFLNQLNFVIGIKKML